MTIQIHALQNSQISSSRLQTFTLPVIVNATQSSDEGNYNSSVYANTLVINVVDDDKKIDIDFICGAKSNTVEVDTDPRPANNDIIYINFTESTNRLDVSSKLQIDQLFTFSSSIGKNYTGSWSSDGVQLKIVSDACIIQ